jgi:hypothetical protein
MRPDRGHGLKVGPKTVDALSMLIALTLLTVGFVAVVAWLLHGRKGRLAPSVAAVPPMLPADDLPPASAIGWPPGGKQFTSYVDNGFAALDAYLSEGYAA